MLYSENTEVVAMVSKMAHSSQASSDTMDLVGHLFREPGFLDDYFKLHKVSRPHHQVSQGKATTARPTLLVFLSCPRSAFFSFSAFEAQQGE